MGLSNCDQQLRHVYGKINDMNLPQVACCIEIRSSINLLLKDYLLSTDMKCMHNEIVCPFCGGQASIKFSILDRITTMSAGTNIPDIGAGTLGVGVQGRVSLQPGSKTNPTYQCVGCNQEYMQANIDINLIINHLHGSRNIAELVRYYYSNEVTLTELLTSYVTGCVRKPLGKSSWLPIDCTKRHLYVCFMYKDIRTFCTFERRKNTKEYYDVKTMGIPNI